MKKNKSIIAAAIAMAALLYSSCLSTDVGGADPAVARGVQAWNSREPEAASAYWDDIEDSATRTKYLNYVTLYEAGVAALDSTDAIKATNETKLLSACNTALTKFNAIDKALKLPEDVCEKGANLSSARISKLLEAEKVTDAKKMYNSAVSVYGSNAALVSAKKELDTVTAVIAKRTSLKADTDKLADIEDLDSRIDAYNALLSEYPTLEADVNSTVSRSGAASCTSVKNVVKSYKNIGQNISIQRAAAIREKAYNYKEMIGEEFARQPDGNGSGKNGAYTNTELLNFYQGVQSNIEKIYNELLAFRAKYPNEIGQDVINDINAQKNDLNSKIAQINKEIAVAAEIASRGKTVMPLMIGLFNPEAGTSGANKKSRPAKFSATKVKGDEYWWGMVSIPAGEMNDLVITMNDNRTVRVFNQNTKSGKLITKNNLKDLVSTSARVGNSWPVLNAGSQLLGTNYYFEVQQGKTDSYSGEVVVYSSFVVRMR